MKRNKQVDLKNLTTLKLESVGELFVIKSEEELIKILKNFKNENINYFVLGNGSNTILNEKILCPVLKLDIKNPDYIFDKIQKTYRLSASTSLQKLTSLALKHSLKGWECFTGIPATLGGAIFMNAGTGLGEISDIVESVEIINVFGEKVIISNDKLKFSYRKNLFLNEGDIISYVTLKYFGIDKEVNGIIKKYLRLRSNSQPLTEHSAGCTYKNYKKENYPAGKFIDLLGLKGLMFKNLQISPVHANFIVNNGVASKKDLVRLLEIIDNELVSTFGFNFEKEIII